MLQTASHNQPYANPRRPLARGSPTRTRCARRLPSVGVELRPKGAVLFATKGGRPTAASSLCLLASGLPIAANLPMVSRRTPHSERVASPFIWVSLATRSYDCTDFHGDGLFRGGQFHHHDHLLSRLEDREPPTQAPGVCERRRLARARARHNFLEPAHSVWHFQKKAFSVQCAAERLVLALRAKTLRNSKGAPLRSESRGLPTGSSSLSTMRLPLEPMSGLDLGCAKTFWRQH
jgi:hypothetical protein